MDADRVQALRVQLGFSRPELARILAVSPMTVYRWEDPACSRPTGLASSVLHALEQAVEVVGAEAVASRILLGIGALLYYRLTETKSAPE